MHRVVAPVVLMALHGVATACSCVKMTGPAWYEQATVVMRGKVVATYLAKNPGLGNELGTEIVRAKVTPSEVLKGSSASAIEVVGGSDYRNPVCRRSLVAGAEYVFAVGSDMVVSTCNSWLVDEPEVQEKLKTFRRLSQKSR